MEVIAVQLIQKKCKIAILSHGNWRADFLSDLLSTEAEVSHLSGESSHTALELRRADFILYDRRQTYTLPQELDENRVFLFDYSAEGTADKIRERGRQLGLSSVRGLLLLPSIHDENMGALPLPPPKKLRPRTKLHLKPLHARQYELFCLVTPTAIRIPPEAREFDPNLPFSVVHPKTNELLYNQRLEWLVRLSHAGLLTSGTGLIEGNRSDLRFEKVEKQYGYSLADVRGSRMSRGEYHRRMRQSKISLCPGGHSRFTYRLFEAMHNRSLVVSVDLSRYWSLPAVPREALVQIPDGQFDSHRIRELLASIGEFQLAADIGYEFTKSLYGIRSMLASCVNRRSYGLRTSRRLAVTFFEYLQRNAYGTSGHASR